MESAVRAWRICVGILTTCCAVALAPPVLADAPRGDVEIVGWGGADARSMPDAAARTFDAGVLRPLGAAQVVAGFGVFVASLPLTLLGNGVAESWEAFVRVPADFTFGRPLGER